MKILCDAVVVGGGIAGVSVAYHLAERGLKDVVLLEKEPLLGTGSSAASAGVIYHHFPEKVNQRLSRASMRALNEFETKFDAKIEFRRSGCVQTASTSEDLAMLRAMHDGALDLGVESHLLSPAQLAEIVPGLTTDDLQGAIYTPDDGYFDPHGVIQGYAAEARRLGVRFLTGTPAIGVIVRSGRIEGVKTPAERISTGVVVDSAGPLAAQVARMAGLPLPITTVKRQIFISAPTDIVRSDAPFYFDRTPPFYFRPESGGLLMSIAEMDQCSPRDLKLDWTSAGVLAQRATRRMPALESLRLMRGWAGLRSMTPDRAAILGPVPEPAGFHLAVGFSGHGVMHSPMTGSIVAAMILDPSITSFDDIDLAPLRFERFARA
jgi:sarcosine oxidase subunit beta